MNFNKLQEIIAEAINSEPDEITSETELTQAGGFEPIDIARIVIQCEKEFHVTIHDEDVHRLKKVSNLAGYISQARADN